jgi:hypothetical protein
MLAHGLWRDPVERVEEILRALCIAAHLFST